MSMNVRDQARRFITLVDELYNARCLLVCSAACPPDQLFAAADSNEEPIIDFEGLQFETAVEGEALGLAVGCAFAPVRLRNVSGHLKCCSEAGLVQAV